MERSRKGSEEAVGSSRKGSDEAVRRSGKGSEAKHGCVERFSRSPSSSFLTYAVEESSRVALDHHPGRLAHLRTRAAHDEIIISMMVRSA